MFLKFSSIVSTFISRKCLFFVVHIFLTNFFCLYRTLLFFPPMGFIVLPLYLESLITLLKAYLGVVASEASFIATSIRFYPSSVFSFFSFSDSCLCYHKIETVCVSLGAPVTLSIYDRLSVFSL